MKNSQKKFLRTRAHSLKPVVIVGSAGITDGVINEINIALDDHELIKVRVNAEDRDERKLMIESISAQTEAILIQTIGHIAILYRPNNNHPHPIVLPK